MSTETETQGNVTDETERQQPGTDETTPPEKDSSEETGQERETLQELGTDEIKNMKGITGLNELRTLCKTEGLPVSGKKDELIDRLLIKKLGKSDRFVPGSIKCLVCGAKARVTGTTKQPFDGNKILITRQVKCNGKNRHTYPIKEIV